MTRFVSTSIWAQVLPSSTPFPTPQPPQVTPFADDPPPFSPEQTRCQPLGDISCDEKVNSFDLAFLRKDINSSVKNTDINDSGTVENGDVRLAIQKYDEINDIPIRTVLLVIDATLYGQLTPEITEFKNDVFQKLGVPIDIHTFTSLSTRTPNEIRDFIKSRCIPDAAIGCQNIEGVILVGDEVPYAMYSQKYYNNEIAPFMYFYEDLDGTFKQNSQGQYIGHEALGVHEGPEIYSAWIRSMAYPGYWIDGFLPKRDPLTQLKDYFAKHHRYMVGDTTPSPQAVFATHCDIRHAGTKSIYLQDLYGVLNTIDVYPHYPEGSGCDDICPLNAELQQVLENKPEFSYIHSHGSPSSIWCYNGYDFQLFSNLPVMMFTWGCANGDFSELTYGSTALSFIHGRDIGLTYFAKLEPNDIANNEYGNNFVNFEDFFRYWKQGDYMGRLYLRLSRYYRHKETPWPNDEIKPRNIYRVSGPLQRSIIGSPFTFSTLARESR